MDPMRYFSCDDRRRKLAFELFQAVSDLPLVCPHGHVDPRLFASSSARFGSPVDLLIIPDHYVLRMLYSRGVRLEELGVSRLPNAPSGDLAVERDHRRIWRVFAENFYLFRGTPCGVWINEELSGIFGVDEPLNADSADRIYDQVAAHLDEAAFTPRALFERFNIQVLCTTDAASDPLEAHAAVRASGWKGDIRPTFRPDALINAAGTQQWLDEVERLRRVSGLPVSDFAGFIQAVEARREFFRQMGAIASDHSVVSPQTTWLEPHEAEAIFQRALHGQVTSMEKARFSAHMLVEMARMSVEDGLVMQIHAGALRDTNPALAAAFGPDKGADMPTRVEFVRPLATLLDRFGNDPRLRLILFTLDESAYTRELAPLAGHYPAVRLGPPWWFHDSLNGMARYFDAVMETAGLYNTAGFNDDTRAFCSIPARHAVWRRASADWLAGLVCRAVISRQEAFEMMTDMAHGLAVDAYRLKKGSA